MEQELYTNEYEQTPQEIAELENTAVERESYDSTYRIGTLTFMLMMGLAFFVDLIQFLITLISVGTIGAIISSMITGIAWIIFYIWFKMNGVGYVDRRIALKIFILLLEFIPLLNALPIYILLTFITIGGTRLEDRYHIKKYLEHFE